MFSASSFIFDGVPSEEFDLLIYEIGDLGDTNDNMLIGETEVIEERLMRSPFPIIFGMEQKDVLSFTLTFGCKEYIDRQMFNEIARWLCRTDGYHYLEIIQDDMLEVRYNCYMTNIRHYNVGGYPFAFKADVRCDCGFAHSYPRSFTFTSGSYTSISIINPSAYQGYIYPELVIKPNNATNSITITNKSDNNRQFKLTNMAITSGEVITIDNRRQIITSNKGTNIYNYFNYNFLRLVQGKNNLDVYGGATLKFTCEFLIAAGT